MGLADQLQLGGDHVVPGAQGAGDQRRADDVDGVPAAWRADGWVQHVRDLAAAAASRVGRTTSPAPSAWWMVRGRAKPHRAYGHPHAQASRPAATSARACATSGTMITARSSAHPGGIPGHAGTGQGELVLQSAACTDHQGRNSQSGAAATP